MGKSCFVPNCTSGYRSNKEKISIFSVPKDEETLQKWKQAIPRKDKLLTNKDFVCAKHFNSNDVISEWSDGVNTIPLRYPKLKEGAVPSIFPNCPKYLSKNVCKRRILKRHAFTEESATKRNKTDINPPDETAGLETSTLLGEIINSKASNVEILPPTVTKVTIGVQTDPTDFNSEDLPSALFCCLHSSTCDAEVQTNIHLRRFVANKIIVQRTENLIGFHGFEDVKDDKTMKNLCGISLAFFQILLRFVQPNAPNQPSFYRTLKSENRLILFLMKMKLGLNFVALGCFFKISDKTASRIFFNTLDTLYTNTNTWVFWPSREIALEGLPKSFCNKYPNCRAIIDCTEIRTDCPPTADQRVEMYSSYKCGFTVKFLIAIIPSGQISFISKSYGGRSTDGFITNDSGFLNLLEPGDLILADKDFPVIKNEMAKRQCSLVTPPFSYNPQFTEKEVLKGYSIASVRMHVEKAVRKVKSFKILDHIDSESLPHVDKIMYLACVLANNKEPVKSEIND